VPLPSGVSGHVLAVDLGTSGVKVAVVDDEGRVLASATEALTTMFLPDGGAEQDPERWWSAIGRCGREAVARAGCGASGVEVVAVTSQYMSIVAIDGRGRPLMNAVMWMDTRGRRRRDHLRSPDPVALWLDRHGLTPLGTNDLAHMAFIRDERPDVHAAAAAYVEPVDYVNARLTGRITATQTTAFPLLTVDNRVHGTLEHSAELVAAAGVDPDKLPPIVAFDEIIGPVTADAAGHLGVTTAAVVVTGTIDSVTSAVGSGALDERACSIIVGTTSVMVTHVTRKASDLDHGILSVPSPLPGRYAVLAENGVGGKALEFLLANLVYGNDAFATAPMPPDAYERAEAAAAAAPVGSGGVLFLPWLVGSMAPAPDPTMRAAFANLSLATTRSHLARAVLEGVALNLRWLLGPVSAFVGRSWDEMCFGGGGASSDLWSAIMADALGLRIRQLAEPRLTNARGAAYLALERLGRIRLADIAGLVRVVRVHEPDPANTERYDELLEAFTALHGATRPVLRALHRANR